MGSRARSMEAAGTRSPGARISSTGNKETLTVSVGRPVPLVSVKSLTSPLAPPGCGVHRGQGVAPRTHENAQSVVHVQ